MSIMSEKQEELHDQYNMRIPEKLHQEFKLAVVKNKTNRADVIRDFIKKYVDETKTKGNLIY